MVTAGTYGKVSYFNSPERLDILLDTLLMCVRESGWNLHAWALMTNHYHIVAQSPDDPASLRKMLGKLHMLAARKINELDEMPGRKVWYQFWDSHITHQKSYLARLRYVHENPVHHGLTQVSADYRWCSAAWFQRNASRAFFNTVNSFNVDRVRVYDDF